MPPPSPHSARHDRNLRERRRPDGAVANLKEERQDAAPESALPPGTTGTCVSEGARTAP